MRTQIHLTLNPETKTILKDASETIGVNLTAFIIYSSVERARKILENESRNK